MELFKKKKGKFAETKIGKIAGAVVPEILEAADNMFTGGKIGDAISAVRNAIEGKAEAGDEAAKVALTDLDIRMEELKLELQKLHLEEMRVEVQDRESARDREKAYLAAGKRDVMVPVLAFIAVIAFAFAMWIIAFKTLPAENRELFVHCLGIIEGAMLVPVFQYVFGSSSSSKRKTEMIDKMQNK